MSNPSPAPTLAPAPRRPAPRTGPVAVGLVGAGYIAGYHLDVLRRMPGVQVVGACDPHAERREALGRQFGIPFLARGLDELLRGCQPEVIHILVPPALHAELAEQALLGGAHVLLEKPIVLSMAELTPLAALARERGLRLAVNHNAIYHPAFQRLLADIAARKLGRIEHVVSFNNLPLGQLESGEHDHWMFRRPENVLFEQGPHPLSQVCELLGEVREAQVMCRDRRVLRTGAPFEASWQASLVCARGTAQMFLSFGRTFPVAVLEVVGQDGSARVDLLANTYALDRRTRRAAPLDVFSRGLTRARQTRWGAVKGLVNYGLSTLRLRGRQDAYYLSMKGGIEAFYRALRAEAPDASAESGRQVTAGLEMMARAANLPRPVEAAAAARPAPRDGEVLVLGGTGFIGRHLLAALAAAGHTVRVLARKPALVPAGANGPSVVVGDIKSPADVERAVAGCRAVIHLVAGAPEGWAEVERLFVGGTRHVAEACLKAGVKQLLFASSICAYYRGQKGVITEDMPIDPKPLARCDYARAKIACEQLLMEMHHKSGLPVTIFRPGLVVGAGSPVEHLGVGTWPSGAHCVSWGRATGRGLPFVLAQDVAAAFVAALGKEGLAGRSFNLVGDVRLSAREYIEILRGETGRDIQLHKRSVLGWTAIELFVWLVKAVGRKANNVRMTYREAAYRSAPDQFDCAAAKAALGWRPVADRERFLELGIRQALAGKAVE